MNDDAALLRHYVAERSEAAFTEIVRRHIGLVHAAALRRVGGDFHLADDVTQTVFISLARKAPALVGRPSLAGWLYLSTQLAAAAVVRGEQRRKARENTAHTMDLTHAPDGPVIDPARLRPLLDDALITLKDDEREAIILRFFQQRTFAEIGDALRVTEEAARKRVDRALDKLQVLLSRRGITSPVAALGVALTAAGAGVMSGELVGRVTSAAIAQAAAGGTAITATGVATALLPVAAAVAVTLGALAFMAQRQANESLAAEVARLGRQNEAMPGLQAENEHLAREIARADARRATAAVAPAPRVARAAPPVSSPVTASNRLTLSEEGIISWEGEPVRLEVYLAKLRALQQGAPDGGSQLVIHANGTRFPQMHYVLDEARKAGIGHILVESDTQPDARIGNNWFWF